jgi:DNA-binding Xre family transcriptional regulator
MTVMPVRWKVKEFLQAHNITPYRFMKESGLAQGTAYRLVNGDTRNLNADTLDAAIRALRTLTGAHVSFSDLLEYEEKGA